MCEQAGKHPLYPSPQYRHPYNRHILLSLPLPPRHRLVKRDRAITVRIELEEERLEVYKLLRIARLQRETALLPQVKPQHETAA